MSLIRYVAHKYQHGDHMVVDLMNAAGFLHIPQESFQPTLSSLQFTGKINALIQGYQCNVLANKLHLLCAALQIFNVMVARTSCLT
jgi:hypothetical protein